MITPPLEKDILCTCRAYLRAIGALAIRINSGAAVAEYKGKRRFVRHNDTPGCADLVCCLQGRFVSVEVKRSGSRTDPKRKAEQVAFAASVAKAGGVALVVHSCEELEADLREAGLV